MNHYVLANLGFEYELASIPLSAAVREQERRFASILRLVDGWRDAAVLDTSAVPANREVLAWGCSPLALVLAGDGGKDWPEIDIVRRVNDKRFSHEVERRLGTALPASQVVSDLDELESMARWLDAWVLKHPFGVAGREQLRGSQWSEDLARAAARLFATASSLVFEPRVQVHAEFSFHFDLDSGGVRRVGVTRLLTDGLVFRGNQTGAESPGGMWDLAEQAAKVVAEAGYHGPLGVDAFTGTLLGDTILRPLVEFNARWSLGRLALELARRLGADIIWHHQAKGRRPQGLQAVNTGAAPGAWLLPDWSDPSGASGTWIEVLDQPFAARLN